MGPIFIVHLARLVSFFRIFLHRIVRGSVSLVFVRLTFRARRYEVVMGLAHCSVRLAAKEFFFQVRVISLANYERHSFLVRVLQVCGFYQCNMTSVANARRLPFQHVL